MAWNWLKKPRVQLFIAWLLLLKMCASSFNLRYSDGEFRYKLRNAPLGYQVEIQHYDTEGQHIRYLELGGDSLPLFVLLHGAPSSSSYFMRYAKDSSLLSKAKLVMVDRPGYGYSGFGEPQLSVELQAKAIAPILRQKRKQHPQIIVLGSSYGGTLAARLAMDYPDLLDALILVQSSVAPGEETTYDISYPSSYPPLSWWVATPLQNANAEKLSHREQLEAMEPGWDSICVPTIILHGEDDGLIFPSNAHFAKERLVNAPEVLLELLPDTGHTIPFRRKPFLLEKMMQSIELARKYQSNRLGKRPLKLDVHTDAQMPGRGQ